MMQTQNVFVLFIITVRICFNFAIGKSWNDNIFALNYLQNDEFIEIFILVILLLLFIRLYCSVWCKILSVSLALRWFGNNRIFVSLPSIIIKYHYPFPVGGNHCDSILQYVLQNVAHLFKRQLTGNEIASPGLRYIFRGTICECSILDNTENANYH